MRARRHPTAAPLALSALLALTVHCSPDSITGPPTHPAGASVTSLPLDGRPHGVAVAPSGVFYVSRIDDDSATRGDLTADGQSLRGSSPTGSTPAHVALHPGARTAYTANQFGNSVSVIDVASNKLSATIPLSDGGFNLITSPDGKRLYVTTAAGTLHTISTGERRVTATRSVGEAANGLAFDSRTGTLYVSSIFAATVTAIKATENEVIRTYAVSWGPQRLALAASGAELYIASQTTGLEVLNLATGAVTAVPGLAAGGVGLALSPDDALLYVTNPPAGRVIVVDRASRAIVRTLTFCSPRNVAFGVQGRVAIVTDECGFVHFVR